MVFRHVRFAHVFGRAGRSGVLAREIGGRLHTVAHRQCRVFVKVGGFLHHADEVADGNFAEHVAGVLRLANVFGEQTGIGLAHFGERFARGKANDVINLEARVTPAPQRSTGMFNITTNPDVR